MLLPYTKRMQELHERIQQAIYKYKLMKEAHKKIPIKNVKSIIFIDDPLANKFNGKILDLRPKR